MKPEMLASLLRQPPVERMTRFFRRLQWKLTLAYAFSMVITVIILGVIGLALLWYFNFRSSWLPNLIASSLLQVSPILSPYMEQTPPDRAGLNNWLHRVIADDNLVINLPTADSRSAPKMPSHFGRVVRVVIVDPHRHVLAGYPTGAFTTGVEFQPNNTPPDWPGFQAALQGQTEPTILAARTEAGHIVAAVPILDAKKQLWGALFIETALPIEQSDFIRLALQGTILPVGLVILGVDLVAGIFFGFFIARGLTRRLRTLTNAADAWSKGNFEVLAPDKSGDELGQLARHLNHMAIQLQNLMQTRQELASLEERNRLARDLHDSVKQQIFATSMQVGAALALLEQNPAAAKERLAETERLVRQAQQELTALIQELRPAALEDKGLVLALREYVTDWARQNNITTEIRVSGEQGLPLLVEQTLFRITQEALANIARHSGATAAEVCLAWIGDRVQLTISDNGRGFNPAAMNGRGVGLRSMRERIEAINGSLVVDSTVGQGTQVIANARR